MVLVVGVAGVPMNPALVARVAQVGGTGNMVSTVHASLITLGIAVGSAAGAAAISLADQTPAAEMCLGAGLAVLAALALAAQTRPARHPSAPEAGPSISTPERRRSEAT